MCLIRNIKTSLQHKKPKNTKCVELLTEYSTHEEKHVEDVERASHVRRYFFQTTLFLSFTSHRGGLPVITTQASAVCVYRFLRAYQLAVTFNSRPVPPHSFSPHREQREEESDVSFSFPAVSQSARGQTVYANMRNFLKSNNMLQKQSHLKTTKNPSFNPRTF